MDRRSNAVVAVSGRENTVKILIVDDHPMLRQGIAAVLKQTDDATSVFQTGTVEGALDLMREHADLDIVILDLFMPGMGGWQAISEFGKTRQDVPIVVVSSSEDPRDVRRALSLGALGYVPKSASPQTLLAAVRLVMNGDLYVPPLLVDEVLPRSQVLAHAAIEGAEKLTDRQIEVLRLLADGHPNKIIAYRLELSEKTVKAHISAIFKALNVVNRTQAANAGRAARLF